MSQILMKFAPDLYFSTRTWRQRSIFSYQSLSAMETGQMIFAIFVLFGLENFTNIFLLCKDLYFIVSKK